MVATIRLLLVDDRHAVLRPCRLINRIIRLQELIDDSKG